MKVNETNTLQTKMRMFRTNSRDHLHTHFQSIFAKFTFFFWFVHQKKCFNFPHTLHHHAHLHFCAGRLNPTLFLVQLQLCRSTQHVKKNIQKILQVLDGGLLRMFLKTKSKPFEIIDTTIKSDSCNIILIGIILYLNQFTNKLELSNKDSSLLAS